MKSVQEIAALALTLIATAGPHENPPPVPAAARTVMASTAIADTFLAPLPGEESPSVTRPPSPQEPQGLSRGIERSLGVALLHIPRGFRSDKCDLLIHFHGATSTLEPQFDASGLRAALMLVNAGIQSGPYESRFADARALDRALVVAQSGLDGALGASSCKIGRVALSAWSAGYGAVLRILTHSRNVERVDAVLLADGMHAGYRDKRKQEVDPVGMAPFRRFASEAAEGRKLFSISHSKVVTQPYASTRETAAYLVDDLGLARNRVTTPGPGTLVPEYRADLRGLHVKGFEGWKADSP